MCLLLRDCETVDAVRKSNPQKMTLARQRVLRGSWVRIPSGAQFFSVSSYGLFFTSPFISFITFFSSNKNTMG